MSKRPNPTQASSGAKRSRKPQFRTVRPPTPPNDQQSQASNSTLFITVDRPDTQRSTLRANNRVLESMESTPEVSRPGSPSAMASIPSNHANNDTIDQPSLINVDVPLRKRRARQTKNADLLAQWLNCRDLFLDEILRQDGLGKCMNTSMLCDGCGDQAGLFKCRDCSNGGLLKCPMCIVSLHSALPLHRIERWNGECFERDLLRNLGYRYQLGHSTKPCPCPVGGPRNFVVFDLTGTHTLDIDYCGCIPLETNWTQLLREQWFPATLTRPQTAFTFECLQFFHELTLQGKTNLYDFYNTILRRTDNAGVEIPINRYSEIHRVFRMWRNLMGIKRAGRGHDPGGTGSTSNGELMVECPACPHPGKNLPDNWDVIGPLLYLYTMFLAVDGNFKLKGKERSKVKDIELMPGWGAYVDDVSYKEHIQKHVDEAEISNCESQHDALVRAATRSSPGYSVSGAVVVICSRHCLIRKNGAGDLQKGEKYCNVDFVILASLIGISLLRVVLTYDIVCQFWKNFRKRMEEFPDEMKIPPRTHVEVAIPGWHINGHGESCREDFNLHYMKGAGRTVGEDVETVWSGTNPLASSIREMGPAARRDTLNDHWNGWNFRKIVGFRLLLAKRFQEAHTMSKKQADLFTQLNSTFLPETVAKWEVMVTTWEADPTAPNPYREPKNETTLQDVRLQLSQEDAAQAKLGILSQHKISIASFLMIGFELEENQFNLSQEIAHTKGQRTPKQQADLQEKRTGLFRLIQNWREVQLVYLPHVAALLTSTSSNTPGADTGESPSTNIFPESIPLYMPSSLPVHIRQLPELEKICSLERRLREPLAHDALADVRRQRRVIQGLWQFKRLHVSGTGNKPNTRMISLYKRFELKTKRAAQKYRVARNALLVLDPNGSWSSRLLELHDSDIRGPSREEDDTTTQSRYEPSWIWLVSQGSKENNEQKKLEAEFNDSMRVEWAKGRARKLRWEEELALVQEEMRRVLAYHKWKSEWWRGRAHVRTHSDPSIMSGLAGYAFKQARICQKMGAACARYWLPILSNHGITPSWASDYKNIPPPINESPEEDLEEEDEVIQTGGDVDDDDIDQVPSQSSQDMEVDSDFDFS